MSAVHWRITYPGNLKRAYYITIGGTLLVLLIAFGYVKGRDIIRQRQAAMAKSRTVTFTYAQLGPPPSLSEEEAMTAASAAATPSAPTVGIPKPVEDKDAITETSATQTELGGQSPLTGVTGGNVVVQIDTSIPPPGTYTPHSVNAEPRREVAPIYPESAKLLGIEGTVWVYMFVDEKGDVIRVAIGKGSGHPALDSAAADAAWKQTFSPARQGDKPVRLWVSRPFRFNLQNL